MPVFLFARWVKWLNPPKPPTCCRLDKICGSAQIAGKNDEEFRDHPWTIRERSWSSAWRFCDIVGYGGSLKSVLRPVFFLRDLTMFWSHEFSGERLATTNLMNKTTGLGLSEDLIVSVVELCTTVLFLIIYTYDYIWLHMLVSMLHAQGNLHGHLKASSQYKNRMGIS